MQSILDMALLKNSVLVKLDLKSWGNQRKAALPKSAVEEIVGQPVAPGDLQVETPEQKEVRLKKAQAMLKLSKELVISPEYEAVKSFMATAKKRVLDRYCNPSFIDEGLYSIKREVLPEALKELELAKQELAERMVPKFLEAYPKQVGDAAGVLNGQFNPKDYPGIALVNGQPEFQNKDELAKRFDIRWRVTALSVPDNLPPEIREAEEKKLREAFQQAEAKITETLYTGLATMIGHISDRMKPTGPGEKEKVFHYTILQNLMDWIQNFKNKDVFNDVRLAQMVEKAEDILQTIGQDPKTMAKRLRDYTQLKDRTSAAFADLKTDIDKAITELPKRTFDLSEE